MSRKRLEYTLSHCYNNNNILFSSDSGIEVNDESTPRGSRLVKELCSPKDENKRSRDPSAQNPTIGFQIIVCVLDLKKIKICHLYVHGFLIVDGFTMKSVGWSLEAKINYDRLKNVYIYVRNR